MVKEFVFKMMFPVYLKDSYKYPFEKALTLLFTETYTERAVHYKIYSLDEYRISCVWQI